MAKRPLRQRLVEASLAGRFEVPLGIGLGLAVLGLVLFAMALRGPDADRAWQLFHVNWVFFTGLAAGSIAFAAAQKITNARWSGMVIRFSEAAVAFAPVSLVGLLLIFTVGYQHIYGPMQAQMHSLSPGKQLWLSNGFMFGRLFVGLSVMFLLGWVLVRTDMIPDAAAAKGAATGGRRALFERLTRGYDNSPAAQEWIYRRLRILGPTFAVVYAIVLTLVAFDGMMALQPHWFSNLFGGWYFMGSFLGGHMLLALLMIHGGKHLGVEDLISGKQRHDLGKLCFGFSIFWCYLMWAQFQIIWYANLPEETGFVFARLWGPWVSIAKAVMWGIFLIPFIVLLFVAAKKSRPVLGAVAVISLAALWLERYLMIMPSVSMDAGPQVGIPELGTTALFIGLFLACYALFGRTWPMISPRLAEITLQSESHHLETEHFDFEDQDRDFVHL